MISEFAEYVFSFFCHQHPTSTWMLGETSIAVCQRCTGLYVGSAIWAVFSLLPFMRITPTRQILFIHGILVMQMVLFGYHLVPHGPTMRTITGQLFAIGIVYFLLLLPKKQWQISERKSPKLYLASIPLILLFLQLLVHLPWNGPAFFLEGMAILGLGILIGCSLLNLILIGSRVRRRVQQAWRSSRVMEY